MTLPYRRLLKKWHICPDCKEQDAWTFGGHTYCYECNEKRNGIAREWRKTHNKQTNVKRKERYAMLREQHRCTRCGRELPVNDSHANCVWCRKKQSNKRKRDYEYKRIGGICYQCCKSAPMPGRKLCAQCYDRNMVKLRMAWTAKEDKKNG